MAIHFLIFASLSTRSTIQANLVGNHVQSLRVAQRITSIKRNTRCIFIPESGSGHFPVGFGCLENCATLLTTQQGSATGAREIFKRLAFTYLDKDALNSCPRASNDLSHHGNIPEAVEKGDYHSFFCKAHFSPGGFGWGTLFCRILEFSGSLNHYEKKKNRRN